MKYKDSFFDGLSAEFERHFAKITDSELDLEQYINDAEVILKRHKNGFRAGDMGNFMNNNDEYIDENGEVITPDEKDQKLSSNKLAYEFFREANMDCPVGEFESPLLRKGDPETSINEFIMKAYVCYHWGVHQKNSGMHEESHRSLLQALRFLNMRDGAYKALHIKRVVDERALERKNNSKEGGDSRKKIYAPLKLNVIKLLLKNKPNDGWKSKKQAIDSLLKEIDEFIREEEINLDLKKGEERLKYKVVGSTMYKRIYDWSLKDEIIEAIFNEVIATPNADKRS